LLKAQRDGHKRVYVLASHQHFYIRKTRATRPTGRTTAASCRVGWSGRPALCALVYRIRHRVAMTNVYGSLVAGAPRRRDPLRVQPIALKGTLHGQVLARYVPSSCTGVSRTIRPSGPDRKTESPLRVLRSPR
jgi:hypothetical protein